MRDELRARTAEAEATGAASALALEAAKDEKKGEALSHKPKCLGGGCKFACDEDDSDYGAWGEPTSKRAKTTQKRSGWREGYWRRHAWHEGERIGAELLGGAANWRDGEWRQSGRGGKDGSGERGWREDASGGRVQWRRHVGQEACTQRSWWQDGDWHDGDGWGYEWCQADREGGEAAAGGHVQR